MCFQCDHPELSYGDYLELVILPLVRDRGWAVQGVGGRRPFAYTVGLTEVGLPELVITGLRGAGALVLDAVAGQLVHQQLPLGTASRAATARLSRSSRSSGRRSTCSPRRRCTATGSAGCSSSGPTGAAATRSSRRAW